MSGKNLMTINTILLTDSWNPPRNIWKLGSPWIFQHWNWSPLGKMMRCSRGQNSLLLFLLIFKLVTDNCWWPRGKKRSREPALCWFLDLSIQLTNPLSSSFLQHSKGCKKNFYSTVSLKSPSRFLHLCSVIPTIFSFARRQFFILSVCIKPWFALGCSAVERDRKWSGYRDLLLGDFSSVFSSASIERNTCWQNCTQRLGLSQGFWLSADLMSSPFVIFLSSFCGHHSLYLLVLPQTAELECLF